MGLKQFFVGLVLLGTIGCSNGQYAVTSSSDNTFSRTISVDTETGKVWVYSQPGDDHFKAVKVDGLWTENLGETTHGKVSSSTPDFLPHFYHRTARTTGNNRKQEGPK